MEEKIITVSKLFDAAGLRMSGPILWGEPIPQDRPGIYVIATTQNPDAAGEPIDTSHLTAENQARWNAQQPIVYIGRTKRSIRQRIKEFYVHQHGDPAPHRGGQDIKLLQCDLWVYWSATDDNAAAEDKMIEFFKARVSQWPFGNRAKAARVDANDDENSR